MTKITIKVTEDILYRSRMCITDNRVGQNCAIALAVREIAPMAIVDRLYINWDGDERVCSDHYTPMTKNKTMYPAGMLGFIQKFDSSTPDTRIQMTPISFEVEVPDSFIETIGIEEALRIIEKSETLEIVKS